MQDLNWDHENNRIMCFLHVINICSTHIIEGFTELELVDAEFDPSLPPRDPDLQTYDEAVAWDPIALCHAIICVIHASGQRLDLFTATIIDGNVKGWFVSPTNPHQIIKVPELQLLCDVRTCWDSIYFMIRWCCEMHQVCNLRSLTTISTYTHSKYQGVDHFLSSPLNKDLAKLWLTDREWAVLQDFEMILSVSIKYQPPVLSTTNSLVDSS